MVKRHRISKPRKKYKRKRPPSTILVVCEGEKTEKYYFEDFQANSGATNIRIEVRGTGYNTKTVVEEAQRINEIPGSAPYIQTWCVFDHDSYSKRVINEAFELANNLGYIVAFSNQCFEIWYLLHFDYIDADLDRARFKPMLRKRLGRKYEKNEKNMYEKLLPHQSTAIRNAENLNDSYNLPCENIPCPSPSTTVVNLVKFLNSQFKIEIPAKNK